MTKYGREPLDFSRLRTVPIAARGGKVTVDHFGTAPRRGMTAGAWLDSLPRILAAESLRALVRSLRAARERGKPVIWGLGGHIVKCGLAPALIELMRHGYATAFAMNGAAAIHDFEIAIAGQTSEDVEAVLPDGSFGAAEETGREMNLAYRAAARDGIGAGEALGRYLDGQARPEFAAGSLLLNAWRASVPVTVHIAVGTDTPHTHPAVDPAALGTATHHDFRLFCALVGELQEGGVYINAGSAVVLPEVFLKAVSAVRNLGHPLREFTTANLDFLQHYRPTVNVVSRPHAQAGGQGIAITGHHEIMVPLLAAVLLDAEAR
ncbi:MAG: hypothetical protein KIT09_20760 [Bryobacteraceae bacterium]|nr:hypothetical protein [Bryobacteraceae bacterium]